jgi:hypothetical protein
MNFTATLSLSYRTSDSFWQLNLLVFVSALAIYSLPILLVAV